MVKKKIHFLGGSNALKPKIIVQLLLDTAFFELYECAIITDSNDGIFVNYCLENNLKVIIIENLNLVESSDLLKINQADMLISIGWDKLVPEEILNLYNYCVNCHGGYLPDYKGNRAYMAVYANIEDYYGATIHFMTKDFDKGNIITQLKLKYFLEETPLILHRRLCELSAFMIPTAVDLVFKGYKGEKQSGVSRYFYKMTKDEMDEIHNENVIRLNNGEDKIVAKYK